MREPRINVVGAASSIGIRPYDDGTVRHLHRAPEALRAAGLIERLGAHDLGDVNPPPYVDVSRPGLRPRNESRVLQYSYELARRIAAAAANGTFVLAVGGDCSILLGSLLGVHAGTDRVGLVYIDAHSDFNTPEESVTGSVAGMAPAFATGRGDSPLARLAPGRPLVAERDVVMIGRRDDVDGQAALRASAILDLPHTAVRERGAAEIARVTLAHFERSGVRRFWIHFDADVLDPSVMPAVDSPEPDGMSFQDATELLRALANVGGAVGLEVTIFDPHLDPDGSCARTIVSLLEQSLTSANNGTGMVVNGDSRSDFFSHLVTFTRAPEIPESADVYGWLCGSWDLDVLWYRGVNVAERGLKGEVHAARVLEGRAVQDVWIMPRSDERSADSDRTMNMYGTTLRTWDAATQSWRIAWTNPVRGHHEEQVGRWSGRDILQEGTRPDGTKTRWAFTEITEDAFRWRGEALYPNGSRWNLEAEFLATRMQHASTGRVR